MRTYLHAVASLAFAAALASPSCAAAAARVVRMDVPKALAITPATKGIEDIRFGDLFRLPVGPKGLEPTDRLRALDGRRVRIVAYMACARPSPSSWSNARSRWPPRANTTTSAPSARSTPASSTAM